MIIVYYILIIILQLYFIVSQFACQSKTNQFYNVMFIIKSRQIILQRASIIYIKSNNHNKIMNKSSLENSLKTPAHYSTDLVSLDFKSQSLNKFLENVVHIVNQHSSKINQLQMTKITTEEVRNANIQLINASKLPPNLTKDLPFVNITNDHETHAKTINDLCGSLTLHGHGFQHLIDLIKKLDQKVDTLSGSLSTFQTADNSKQLFRKAGQTSKKFTQDQIAKILTRVKDVEMTTAKKISEFQNLTRQVQKKTLWKITQCQQSLLKKITPEYVDRALSQVQAQILSKIDQTKNQSLNQLKFNFEALKQKVDSLSKDVEQYQKQNKKMIKQLQEDAKGFERRQKMEKDMRDVQGKFKQVLIKIDKLQKREHPQDLELRIMKITSEHQEKLNSHHQKLKKLDIELSSINNVMSSMSTGTGGGGDPHKLCQLDGQIRKLRDSNRTTQIKVQGLQDQLKTKLLIFQERVMTTLGMLKGQDNFVSREQMYESITRLRQPINQRLNEDHNLINELNNKLGKLQLSQKSTKRKIKQMTRGDQLNKILDLKMNVAQAQSHFNSFGMKMQTLEVIMNKIKMEMESNSDFLKMLQRQMNEPEEGFSLLGPKTKVFPAKCLGCGQKHIPPSNPFENSMMPGSDGKLYKVDLKTYSNMNQRQVYGVTSSQIATYQSPLKAKLITRPTSGKTVTINGSHLVRPSSSKHF